MEPSDIDGRPGDETPGQMLERLMAGPDPTRIIGEDGIIYTWVPGWRDTDDIAAQFKAAVLAGLV